MKAPTSSNMKAVEKNLRRATKQATYVIFDCRRMKSIPENAIEREIRICVSKRIKTLKTVLFVNRKGQVIDIQQQ